MIAYDGIIINPGGLTHTSVSFHDSLENKTISYKIEVHISNIYASEEFRHKSSHCTRLYMALLLGMGSSWLSICFEA